MPHTLEQLGTDIRKALKADPGPGGKQAVCQLVSKALLDKEFVAAHLTAEECRPRKVLYEDPELGFCICGHVYRPPRPARRTITVPVGRSMASPTATPR